MADPASYAYHPPNVAEAYGPSVPSSDVVTHGDYNLQSLKDVSAIQAGRERAANAMPYERVTGMPRYKNETGDE